LALVVLALLTERQDLRLGVELGRHLFHVKLLDRTGDQALSRDSRSSALDRPAEQRTRIVDAAETVPPSVAGLPLREDPPSFDGTEETRGWIVPQPVAVGRPG
jgi:hypothetical protein